MVTEHENESSEQESSQGYLDFCNRSRVEIHVYVGHTTAQMTIAHHGAFDASSVVAWDSTDCRNRV